MTVLATNGIGPLAMLGFFAPAVLVVAVFGIIVWRDRRSADRASEVLGGPADEGDHSAGAEGRRRR